MQVIDPLLYNYLWIEFNEDDDETKEEDKAPLCWSQTLPEASAAVQRPPVSLRLD